MYSIILLFLASSKISTLTEITGRNINPCRSSLSCVFFSLINTHIISAAGYIAGHVYPSITVLDDSDDLWWQCVDKGICFATFIKAPLARVLKPSLFQSQLRTLSRPVVQSCPARLIRRGVRPHGDEFRNFLHKSASGTNTGENYVLTADSDFARR